MQRNVADLDLELPSASTRNIGVADQSHVSRASFADISVGCNGHSDPSMSGDARSKEKDTLLQVLESVQVQMNQLEEHHRLAHTVLAEQQMHLTAALTMLGRAEASNHDIADASGEARRMPVSFLNDSSLAVFSPMAQEMWHIEREQLEQRKTQTRADTLQAFNLLASTTSLHKGPEERAKVRESFTTLLKRLRGTHGIDALLSALGWRRSYEFVDGVFVPKPRGQHEQYRFLPGSYYAEKIASSKAFNTTISVLIILNAGFVAVLTDHGVKDMLDKYEKAKHTVGGMNISRMDAPGWSEVLDVSFCFIFMLEIILRIVGFECRFFIGNTWKWNLFDLVLVLTSLPEAVIFISSNTTSRTFDLTFVRILRLLRVFRAIRIVRVVRFFRELRIMLLAIMRSIMPLVWVLTFLASVIFLFAVVFLQGVTHYVEAATTQDRVIEDTFKRYFFSFPSTMQTLFMCITAGVDWGDIAKALMRIDPTYGLLFLFYIAVMTLGILNVVTGLFVESTEHLSSLDRDLIAQVEVEKSVHLMAGLQRLFQEFDHDHDGRISRQQFESQIRRPEVQGYLSALEITAQEASGLFRLLDVDQSNEVELDEFVMGCLRLRGGAKTVDVATLMFEQKQMLSKLISAFSWMDQQFSHLEGVIGEHMNEFRLPVSRMSSRTGSVQPTTTPKSRNVSCMVTM